MLLKQAQFLPLKQAQFFPYEAKAIQVEMMATAKLKTAKHKTKLLLQEYGN